VRAVSERLEAIEDGLSRVEVNIARAGAPVAARLAAIEEQLADTTRLLGEIQAALPGEAPAVSRDQERLRVEAEPIATEPTSWFSRATPLD
jgi:antitoxin (DNA-binding transcriptional repressor) of toxin-antitoxin stability system